jgi:hypothetical protein
MASLYEMLTNAHDGEGFAALGEEFGLTPTQTQAAVTALLPAISTGLKRSTATPSGLGNLFCVMGQQQDLQDMYDDRQAAFGSDGIAAGNDALTAIFGSPAVSQAVVDQAQRFSGVSSDVLKKLLPVLAGIVLSGLMRSGSAGASPPPAQPAPAPPGGNPGGNLGGGLGGGLGGNLGDILGQIFRGGMPGSSGGPQAPTPQAPPRQAPPPPSQPAPVPTNDGGQIGSDGDLLGSILREFEKGIREGRIKPVIIGGGPLQIPLPGGGQRPTPSGSDAPEMPGGDVLGQILRDILGGGAGGPGGAARGPAQMPRGREEPLPRGREEPSPSLKDLSDLSEQLGKKGGIGAAVFGDHFEAGRDVEKSHVDSIQDVFDRYFGARGR